jgi:hypothetical protein
MIGGQGWPIRGGAQLIPPSTVVGDGGIPLSELPSPLPLDVISLDADALAQMKQWYPAEHHHRLLVGPDVGKPQPQTAPEKETSAVFLPRQPVGEA